MALFSSSLSFISSSSLQFSPRIEVRAGNPCRSNLSIKAQVSQGSVQDNGKGRRIWRRRKLTKKDDEIRDFTERVPFLEEHVWKLRDEGKDITMDIQRMLKSEENRFDFVNEVAAEANEYVENNPDEYGVGKKAVLHVLSNRLNDTGKYRPDGYYVPDPHKQRGYVRDYEDKSHQKTRF